MMKLIWYPNCSTCKKAKQFLEENNVSVETRHIVEESLSERELKELYSLSKLPLKRFFNTSGLVYKQLNLKDKLITMSEDEQIKLLASNGMLVKRPILVKDEVVLLGFKKEDYIKII